MVTDPPYGVEYDPSWRNQTGAAKTKRTGKVLNDDRADWREAWALFTGDDAYVRHGALHAATVAESLIVARQHGNCRRTASAARSRRAQPPPWPRCRNRSAAVCCTLFPVATNSMVEIDH